MPKQPRTLQPKTVRVSRRVWDSVLKKIANLESRSARLEHEAKQVNAIRQKDAQVVSYLKAVLVLLKQR